MPLHLPSWRVFAYKKRYSNNESEKIKRLHFSPINEENLQIHFYLIRGLA